jgi:head-tail adaptor
VSGLWRVRAVRTRVRRGRGLVLSLTIDLTDRFVAAAEEWAEARLEDQETALETKAEQALLEIEYLVAGRTEVSFDVDVDAARIEYAPSDELAALLSAQADDTGLDESTILRLHVDLFVSAFPGDDDRPPNAPPV